MQHLSDSQTSIVEIRTENLDQPRRWNRELTRDGGGEGVGCGRSRATNRTSHIVEEEKNRHVDVRKRKGFV